MKKSIVIPVVPPTSLAETPKLSSECSLVKLQGWIYPLLSCRSVALKVMLCYKQLFLYLKKKADFLNYFFLFSGAFTVTLPPLLCRHSFLTFMLKQSWAKIHVVVVTGGVVTQDEKFPLDFMSRFFLII